MLNRVFVASLLTTVALLAGRPSTVQGDEQAATGATNLDDATSAEQLEEWLAELDSDRYAVRERATDSLLAAGARAVPYLREAAFGNSLEAADRAVWTLQQLADSNEQSLQLAALEVLVAADRFPSIAREADAALAELQSQLCCTRLVELGAEFISRPDREYAGAVLVTTLNIKVNTNRSEWTGDASDLMLLTKLRRVGKLTVASALADDEMVARLAKIKGLESLTLIETNVSSEMIDKLKTQNPELRLVVHTRAKLGVRFFEGQPLNITEVQSDSPAEKAGLRAGDRVTNFAGQPVDSFERLTALIAQHPPGKNVDIIVERGNESLTLTAELGGTDWWEELKDL